MKSQLTALQTSLAEVLGETPDTGFACEVMTPEQLLTYAHSEVDLSKAETDDEARPRLSHLLKNVTTMLSKNAFDGMGTAVPVYRGENSRTSMTAASEMKAADMGKGMGMRVSFESANTEANPGSNAFGRGGPQHGNIGYSFRGMIGKSADGGGEEPTEENRSETVEAIAKAAKSDAKFREMLLAQLAGEADDPDGSPATKSNLGDGWPRDMAADEIDNDPDLQF